MKIPGLSFSLKRAVGISALKGKVAKAVVTGYLVGPLAQHPAPEKAVEHD